MITQEEISLKAYDASLKAELDRTDARQNFLKGYQQGYNEAKGYSASGIKAEWEYAYLEWMVTDREDFRKRYSDKDNETIRQGFRDGYLHIVTISDTHSHCLWHYDWAFGVGRRTYERAQQRL